MMEAEEEAEALRLAKEYLEQEDEDEEAIADALLARIARTRETCTGCIYGMGNQEGHMDKDGCLYVSASDC